MYRGQTGACMESSSLPSDLFDTGRYATGSGKRSLDINPTTKYYRPIICSTFFHPSGFPCPASMWGLFLCLIVTCFVLILLFLFSVWFWFCPVWLSSLGGLLFSEGKGAGAEVGHGEEGIGWQCCEECRAGILCLREHIFLKNEKLNEWKFQNLYSIPEVIHQKTWKTLRFCSLCLICLYTSLVPVGVWIHAL